MSGQWEFLSLMSHDIEEAGIHDLGEGAATIISDRVISSLSIDDRAQIDAAQTALESVYLDRLSSAPASAARAARGEDGGATPEAAAFALGQLGMAHAIVAHAASKRVDDAFERRLTSRALERYVRLLVDEELSGAEMAKRLEKDPAQVSHRLKILRQIGAVECRREGNRVVNFLTQAARSVVRARNMGALSAVGQPSLRTEVSDALDDHRQYLPEQMRHSLILVVAAGDSRRAL